MSQKTQEYALQMLSRMVYPDMPREDSLRLVQSTMARSELPMFAEGGEVGEEEDKEPTSAEARLAQTVYPDLPEAQAVYFLRGGNRQSTNYGERLSGNIGARVPLGEDTEAMLMLSGSRSENNPSSSKDLLAMLNQRIGQGDVGATLIRPTDAPSGLYAGSLSGSYPLGEGRISGNVNAMRFPDGQTKMTGYGVGYGGRVGPGDLSVGVSRQGNSGPFSGQLSYRIPIGRADGSPEEGEVAEPGLLSVPVYSKTVSYEMYPGQDGQFDQRDAARHMLAAGTLSRKYGPKAAEMLGQLHEIGTSPLKFLGSKLGISEMPIDYEQDLHNNRLGIELGKRSKSQKNLEDLVQQMAEEARSEKTEGKAWKGKPVRRANGDMGAPPKVGGAVDRKYR